MEPVPAQSSSVVRFLRNCPPNVLDLILRQCSTSSAAALACSSRAIHDVLNERAEDLLPVVVKSVCDRTREVEAEVMRWSRTNEISFRVYRSFLRSLVALPGGDEMLRMPAPICRLLAALRPRPRPDAHATDKFPFAECPPGTARFKPSIADHGYPGGVPDKGWTDPFGFGGSSDLLRAVGDPPNIQRTYFIAGAEGSQYTWNVPPEYFVPARETNTRCGFVREGRYHETFNWWDAVATHARQCGFHVDD